MSCVGGAAAAEEELEGGGGGEELHGPGEGLFGDVFQEGRSGEAAEDDDGGDLGVEEERGGGNQTKLVANRRGL